MAFLIFSFLLSISVVSIIGNKIDEQTYQEMETNRQAKYNKQVEEKTPFTESEVFTFLQMSSSYPNRKSDVKFLLKN